MADLPFGTRENPSLASSTWLDLLGFPSSSPKKWIYLVVAYGLHALFDLAPSLSQVGWISNPLVVEGILAVEVLAFVFLTKSIFYKKQ